MTGKPVGNPEIVTALREMALRLEMEGVPFKPRAYERAAESVAAVERPLAELYAEGGLAALDEIPGVGKGIAGRIARMIETGHIKDLDRLHRKQPADVLGLDAIKGLGPKRIKLLAEKLGIRDVADLRRAAEEGRLRELPRFGARLERKILEAVAFHEQTAGRRPLGEALDLARPIEKALAEIAGVERVAVAGSLRRRRETVGDLDFLVAANEAEEIIAAFGRLPRVEQILESGGTKARVRLRGGLEADLRVVEPRSFGAALVYFTGSKAHNVALRRIARKRGLKLNEYGLFRGERVLASREEGDVYAALGLAFIPPEIREDAGEIELAEKGLLPELIEAAAIRGDLQVHTSWSDGKASIEDMARAAMRMGREYIVISDHGRDSGTGTGLDEEKLRAQLEEIRRIDAKMPGIRILAGIEANIRADGSLDVADELLDRLDLVAAAVHSQLDMPRSEMTERLLRAIENPRVDMLCHPTCRMIGKRKAIELDFDRVAEACAESGTILEIDAQPGRLDLPDELVHRAIETGARIAIDSDAHAPQELGYIEDYGLGLARRGWVEAKQVANTLPVAELLSSLKGGTRHG